MSPFQGIARVVHQNLVVAANREMSAPNTVIIDNGGSTIKAGCAGEDSPSIVLPTMTGRPKYSRAFYGGDVNSEMFVLCILAVRASYSAQAYLENRCKSIVESCS